MKWTDKKEFIVFNSNTNLYYQIKFIDEVEEGVYRYGILCEDGRGFLEYVSAETPLPEYFEVV